MELWVDMSLPQNICLWILIQFRWTKEEKWDSVDIASSQVGINGGFSVSAPQRFWSSGHHQLQEKDCKWCRRWNWAKLCMVLDGQMTVWYWMDRWLDGMNNWYCEPWDSWYCWWLWWSSLVCLRLSVSPLSIADESSLHRYMLRHLLWSLHCQRFCCLSAKVSRNGIWGDKVNGQSANRLVCMYRLFILCSTAVRITCIMLKVVTYNQSRSC